MSGLTREEADRIADRLEGLRLHEGCGEESCLPENAAGWLRALAAENAALHTKLETAEADAAEWKRQAIYHNKKHGEAISATRASEAAAIEAVETLTFIRDAITESITVNDRETHRIEIDGVWHTGPVVDWAHKVLIGLRDVSGHVVAKHGLTPAKDATACPGSDRGSWIARRIRALGRKLKAD